MSILAFMSTSLILLGAIGMVAGHYRDGLTTVAVGAAIAVAPRLFDLVLLAMGVQP